ncbi:MAG: hypothetical protein HYY09_05400 [Firmicutes bacterium]|nr:hypothetical protein [Bacillota bacterium]
MGDTGIGLSPAWFPLRGTGTVAAATGQGSGSTGGTQRAATPGALDQVSFLKLLSAQLRYQNPMEPTDNQGFLEQLATFTLLQQLGELNGALRKMEEFWASPGGTLSGLVGLVGRAVTVEDPETGIPFSGTVTGLKLEQGQALVLVDERAVDPARIITVGYGGGGQE